MRKLKVRGIGQPHAARLLYAKELYRVIELVEDELAGFTNLSRFDALESSQDSFFHTIRKKLEALLKGTAITLALEGVAQKTESVTESGFQLQMQALLKAMPLISPSSSKLRTIFVQENLKLISSLSETLLNALERRLLSSMRQGSHVREIEKQLIGEIALSKRRARLIARDQVNKYSGDLTRQNQKEAGITHYRWQTSHDERVRSRHKALDGQVFAWNKAPISDKSGGRYHPRQGINCRCDAIPVVEL